MTNRKLATLIGAYVVMAFLYGGWFYNHKAADYSAGCYNKEAGECKWVQGGNTGLLATIIAPFWPVAIAATLAVAVTRWP